MAGVANAGRWNRVGTLGICVGDTARFRRRSEEKTLHIQQARLVVAFPRPLRGSLGSDSQRRSAAQRLLNRRTLFTAC